MQAAFDVITRVNGGAFVYPDEIALAKNELENAVRWLYPANQSVMDDLWDIYMEWYGYDTTNLVPESVTDFTAEMEAVGQILNGDLSSMPLDPSEALAYLGQKLTDLTDAIDALRYDPTYIWSQIEEMQLSVSLATDSDLKVIFGGIKISLNSYLTDGLTIAEAEDILDRLDALRPDLTADRLAALSALLASCDADISQYEFISVLPYYTALQNAESVLSAPESLSQIEAAIAALEAQKAVVAGLTKTTDNKKLAELEALLSASAEIMTAIGKGNSSEWVALATEMRGIIQEATASDAEADAAYERLLKHVLDAVEKYTEENGSLPAGFEEYEELLAKKEADLIAAKLAALRVLKNASETTVIALGRENLTEESVKEFDKALLKASALLSDLAKPSVAEIEAVIAAVQAALEGLCYDAKAVEEKGGQTNEFGPKTDGSTAAPGANNLGLIVLGVSIGVPLIFIGAIILVCLKKKAGKKEENK
jgi:hypothetical protein